MTDPIRRAEQAARLLDHQLMREARASMAESLTRQMWRRNDQTVQVADLQRR